MVGYQMASHQPRKAVGGLVSSAFHRQSCCVFVKQVQIKKQFYTSTPVQVSVNYKYLPPFRTSRASSAGESLFDSEK